MFAVYSVYLFLLGAYPAVSWGACGLHSSGILLFVHVFLREGRLLAVVVLTYSCICRFSSVLSSVLGCL